MNSYFYLALTLQATVYGAGSNDYNCGDEGKPVACDSNATTASGEPFSPHVIPSAAIPMPTNRIMRPFTVCLYNEETNKSVYVRVNDKAHNRWIGNRGLDLSPAAYKALTGNEAKPWSRILNQLKRCDFDE
jgi:hypothetical protein